MKENLGKSKKIELDIDENEKNIVLGRKSNKSNISLIHFSYLSIVL